jgi:hypothetical protein
MCTLKVYHSSSRKKPICEPFRMAQLRNNVRPAFFVEQGMKRDAHYAHKPWERFWISTTDLPWITETRKPAPRIVSSSLVVSLWVQHALTWPSNPQLDCIPEADMFFTYSWKYNVRYKWNPRNRKSQDNTSNVHKQSFIPANQNIRPCRDSRGFKSIGISLTL